MSQSANEKLSCAMKLKCGCNLSSHGFGVLGYAGLIAPPGVVRECHLQLLESLGPAVRQVHCLRCPVHPRGIRHRHDRL